MEIIFLTTVFVLGLCCGSFVNMLVYRTAVDYGLIKSKGIRKNSSFLKMLGGRSLCDDCGRQLKWYENIPVVSWLVQGGRSRCCHKKLPILYPIVELVTGAILVLITWKFNLFSGRFSLPIEIMQLFWLLVIATLLVFLTVFDFKFLILPDFAIIILVVITFLGVVFDEPNVIPYLVSAVASSGFLYFLYLITKKKGMGLGDVKLAFFMGLFLGYPKIITAMYVAFIIGALFGLILICGKKATRKTKISFGPFLILGTFVAWILNFNLFNWL